MTSRKSIASSLLFVGSALCFFLPFVTVSCGGVTAFTLTGQQLATGTTLTQPQPFGPPQAQKVSADPFAVIAGLCAIAGIALSLIGRKLASAAAISGGVGGVSLLIMRSRLDDQLQTQGQGLAKATYETGFTLAVLLLIAGAAWNVYLFLQSRRLSEASRLALDTGQSGKDDPSIQSESPPLPTEKQGSFIAAHDSEGQTEEATRNEQPVARICRHCAQPIRATARFCESCGRSAEITEGSPDAQFSLKRGNQ
jgi:hypothetical protein